jgi:nicotinate dehydrogenase subunit B
LEGALAGSLTGHSRTHVVDVAPDTPLREGLRDALDAWIRINADGTVMVFTGKVEIGQSIKTALAQVAAEELDVSLDRHRQVGGHV